MAIYSVDPKSRIHFQPENNKNKIENNILHDVFKDLTFFYVL